VRRIRVLYFVSSFEQGGAERQVAELVRNLPRDRFEPHLAVCTSRNDFGYELDVASSVDLRSPRGPSPKTFLSLLAHVRALRPDVVHAVHDPQNTYARLAVKLARHGVAVASLRCTRLPRRTIRRERWTHGLGGALVVNSVGIRDELARRAKIDHAIVIENGVDTTRFVPLSPKDRDEARSRFGMRGDTIVLPGRISRQKNQLAAIRAVASMRARGAWPDGARLVLAGRVEAHTRYVRLVDAAILLLRVGDVVERIAAVRDAERLVAAADCVLLPSRFEGLPNVVLESLACGTPAIVSPEANADAIVDRATGFVLDGSDARDVAVGFARFFATTRAERAAMGVRGRASVLARFDVARMVAATCAVYERVAPR
jgi:glycosyltransferase involved in cell wall biosynthesis